MHLFTECNLSSRVFGARAASIDSSVRLSNGRVNQKIVSFLLKYYLQTFALQENIVPINGENSFVSPVSHVNDVCCNPGQTTESQGQGVSISESNSSIDDFLELLSKHTGYPTKTSNNAFFQFTVIFSADTNMEDTQLKVTSPHALNSDQNSIMDILSLMDLPSDYDSNHPTNNNFDANNSMDVDQDVADWLNSIQSSTSSSKLEYNGNRNHQTLPIISDPILMSTAMNSPSASVNSLQAQSIFASEDAEMCSSTFWGS